MLACVSVASCYSQATWQELVGMATGSQVDLTGEGWFSNKTSTDAFQYFVYAAGASVVEVDVLTGEVEVGPS